MKARRQSLAEAVGGAVTDGSCVWIGNFGTQLFAVGRELIDQGRHGLHVVLGSGGLLLDQLLDAGVAAEVTFAHCWSPVGPHPTRAFRSAWEDPGEVRFHELSFATLEAALGAGAAGVPFAPVPVPLDSEYAIWTASRLAPVDSPFGPSLVVAALRPDVAFVHAACADDWGNAALGAPSGEALAAVGAARQTVVVAERIVSTAEVSKAGVSIPGVLVDAVVESPGGAMPDGVAGLYQRDVEAYERYVAG